MDHSEFKYIKVEKRRESSFICPIKLKRFTKNLIFFLHYSDGRIMERFVFDLGGFDRKFMEVRKSTTFFDFLHTPLCEEKKTPFFSPLYEVGRGKMVLEISRFEKKLAGTEKKVFLFHLPN